MFNDDLETVFVYFKRIGFLVFTDSAVDLVFIFYILSEVLEESVDYFGVLVQELDVFD